MPVSFSFEVLLVFIAVLFVSFICGVCRTLSEYYKKKSVTEEMMRQNSNRVTVSHINVNNSSNPHVNNAVINYEGNVNPPPPYPENDLPPSYEEAVSNSFQSLENIPQESTASKE